MVVELDDRVTALEVNTSLHESRITKLEDKVDKIQTGCAGSMASIETKVTDVLNNNKSMIKIMSWSIITLITILASLFGVKIVDPQLLASIVGS